MLCSSYHLVPVLVHYDGWFIVVVICFGCHDNFLTFPLSTAQY